MRDVIEGNVYVLLVSPETLVGGAFWTGYGDLKVKEKFPPVAFACIDEVHCVSEWSHNFRASYFQIRKVNIHNVQCPIICNIILLISVYMQHSFQLKPSFAGEICMIALSATLLHAGTPGQVSSDESTYICTCTHTQTMDAAA